MPYSAEKKFITSIRWNLLEGITQNVLLFGHHLMLFNVVSRTLFGQAGTAIATTYLLAHVASAGFYATIGSSFRSWRYCQHTFLVYIVPHIIGTACVGFLLTGVVLAITWVPVGNVSYLILSGLVISEAVRETLKATAQTIFANKAHTTINTLAIAAYCTIVWSYYYIGNSNLNLHALLLPLLGTSVVANVALLYTIAHWFGKTTDQENDTTHLQHKVLLKNRLHGAVYTLSSLPFNGNFLIPALAFRSGFADVASLKLANDATHYIGNLMRKALYTASHSFFAHTLTANGVIPQHSWRYAHATLHCMLAWYIPLGITAGCIATLMASANLLALLAFGLLKLGDCAIAPNETRCFVESKPHFLTALGVVGCLVIATLFTLPSLLPGLILCVIATIRIALLCVFWSRMA